MIPVIQDTGLYRIPVYTGYRFRIPVYTGYRFIQGSIYTGFTVLSFLKLKYFNFA
jgi:hypothetical protein